tara:strand:+ start:1309 stop:1560 length:252 start_codon:yes stop_codon:yes gene_type:complete
MKVGDLVQYVDHASWENSGLGIVMDAKEAMLRCGTTTLAFQITWFDDIEDYGWTKAIENRAQWYNDADFEKDIKLFLETYESR